MAETLLPDPDIEARLPAPPYVRRVMEEAARTPLVPVSAARRDFDPATPVLISVIRDETPVLEEFLAHYRRLGVERFAIIDNGSQDASARMLAGEADVDLYAVPRPFHHKQGWINAAISRYGYGRWYLHADADEHLVFDGAPGRGLRDLIAFAEGRNLRRLRGMLVDMYGPGKLAAPAPVSGTPGSGSGKLAARFPLFDGTGYEEQLYLERISRKGGPRRRKFARAGDRFDPELTKYPLFHIRAGEVFSSPHHIHPYHENYASECYLGLLHYKFTENLLPKARRASAEENYWDRSREYKRYLDVLAREPDLDLAYAGTRRYRGPADLIAAGLIAPIPRPARPRRLRNLLPWRWVGVAGAGAG